MKYMGSKNRTDAIGGKTKDAAKERARFFKSFADAMVKHWG